MPIVRLSFMLCALLLVAAPGAGGQTPVAAGQGHVDPTASLESRLGEPDASVLKMFADAGMPAPTRHVPTEAERQSLARAFAALPPQHQRVLRERLRRISFLDGMPNTALTSTVDPDAPVPVYDLTIRAGVLRETVSEFLTWKERTCFDAAGSTRTVVVEAGSLEAIVYVLLHEATHMVDGALGLTPGAVGSGSREAHPLTEDVWNDRLTIAPAYASPRLAGLAYRRGGRPVPIAEAVSVYEALRRTPFASLYGSSNWHDDLAELATWHHLTSRLGQPYRIVVRERDREVFVYEPMASPLVQRRLPLLMRSYQNAPVAPPA